MEHSDNSWLASLITAVGLLLIFWVKEMAASKKKGAVNSSEIEGKYVDAMDKHLLRLEGKIQQSEDITQRTMQQLTEMQVLMTKNQTTLASNQETLQKSQILVSQSLDREASLRRELEDYKHWATEEFRQLYSQIRAIDTNTAAVTGAMLGTNQRSPQPGRNRYTDQKDIEGDSNL